MIDNWFGTQIYTSRIDNEFLGVVQKELSDAYDSNDFSGNIIDQHSLNNFRLHAMTHVFSYLKEIKSDIGFKPEKPLSFGYMSSFRVVKPGEKVESYSSEQEADISGVYYFKTTGNDGMFFVENPFVNSRNWYPTSYQYDVGFTPEVGKLILFPAWLPRGEEENKSETDKVALEFNIKFERV